MLKLLDWCARKLGRKYAFVDEYGQILFYRYYVFFVEKHIASNWRERYLPNLFVHHFIGVDNKQWIDGEECHSHPWDAMSLVLRGGYVEDIAYGERTVRTTAPGVAFTSYKSSHRFLEMTPGTVTLFFHGVRRGMWSFDLRKHDVICPACQQFNGGVCINTPGPEEFDAAIELRASAKAHRGWRQKTWIKCDQDFEGVIAERQESLRRSALVVPDTLNERNLNAKVFIVKRRVQAAQTDSAR